MKFPTIKTSRFRLRQFTDADLENVFKGLSHPEVIKYYGVSFNSCLLYTSPSPRDGLLSRMPSSA